MISITATVEFEIESDEIEDFESDNLLNELVKVKSGNYENQMVGIITKIVEVVTDDVIHPELTKNSSFNNES